MTLVVSVDAFCVKVYFGLLTLLPPGSWEKGSPRQSEADTSRPKRAGEGKIRLTPQWTTQPLCAQGSWGILSSVPWGHWNEATEEEYSLEDSLPIRTPARLGIGTWKLSCVHTRRLHLFTLQLRGVCGQWESLSALRCVRGCTSCQPTIELQIFLNLSFSSLWTYLSNQQKFFLKDKISFYL